MTRPITPLIRPAIFALLLAVAALIAAVPLLLPPPASTTPAATWQPVTPIVRGAFHVHSVASDGTGSVDEIAAAAARAGLQFVILTDHGDGTRVPEPPRYRSGVLCIEAVEVSTSGGHLAVLGAKTSPFPLAGSPHAVLEDAHRLGGMGIAAHPGSPRASLQWRDWTVPVDGLEWLNADSEWRDEFLESIGRHLLTYALRPRETLTATLDRPSLVLDKWDELTATRRVVGLAGADAHARLGFRQQTEPYEEGWHLRLPSYDASFGAFGIRVAVPGGLSGDAGRDVENLITHIRLGRLYSVVDGIAGPGAFEFSATSGDRRTDIGGYLDIRGEVVLHTRMVAPDGARLVILKNGQMLFDTREREAHFGVPAEPAVYRAEIIVPGGTGDPPIPWLVSNPIYVGMRERHQAAATPQAAAPVTRRSGVATEMWGAEASPGSVSRLGPPPTGANTIEWSYRLAGGARAGQYAAVRFPVDGLLGHDRIQLRAHAKGPMRLWVQVRASTVGNGERWGRTVYLDENDRSIDVPLDELEPLGATSQARPPLDTIDVVLLVVDTLNNVPGTDGAVQLTELWLAAP